MLSKSFFRWLSRIIIQCWHWLISTNYPMPSWCTRTTQCTGSAVSCSTSNTSLSVTSTTLSLISWAVCCSLCSLLTPVESTAEILWVRETNIHSLTKRRENNIDINTISDVLFIFYVYVMSNIWYNFITLQIWSWGKNQNAPPTRLFLLNLGKHTVVCLLVKPFLLRQVSCCTVKNVLIIMASNPSHSTHHQGEKEQIIKPVSWC